MDQTKIFPVPVSTGHSMSKGALGRRVSLNRKKLPVPMHHSKIAKN
ncbi:DUF6653 family protein [Parasphingorhabdus sp. NYA22]